MSFAVDPECTINLIILSFDERSPSPLRYFAIESPTTGTLFYAAISPSFSLAIFDGFSIDIGCVIKSL